MCRHITDARDEEARSDFDLVGRTIQFMRNVINSGAERTDLNIYYNHLVRSKPYNAVKKTFQQPIPLRPLPCIRVVPPHLNRDLQDTEDGFADSDLEASESDSEAD